MSKVLLPGGKLSFISFRPLEPSGNWYESRCTSIDGAMPSEAGLLRYKLAQSEQQIQITQ
jgi:hypothetical protein